jgi:protease I
MRRCPMKKSLVLSMVAMLALGGTAFGQDRPKVLLVAAESSAAMEMMIEKEVRPMEQLLKQAGYDVVVASETGKKLGSGAQELTPDMTLDQVKLGDYKGVVFPCMAARYPNFIIPEALIATARSAYEKGMPIAAQVSGVGTLAKAKILEGKNYGGFSAISSSGGTYQGNGVVQDGKIITSGSCPNAALYFKWKDGTPELMEAFIRLLQQ